MRQHIQDDEPVPRARRAGGGRHRGRTRTGRHSPKAPSFRAAVSLTGAAAAVLTVVTGVYVASLEARAGRDARAAEAPLMRPLAAGADPSAVPPTRPSPVVGADGAARPAGTTDPRASSPVRATVAETPASPLAGAPAAAGAAVPPAGDRRRADRAVTAGRGPADFVQQVIALVNEERERAGCAPVRPERRLGVSAQAHADDMAARGYYAHGSPEGRDAGDRITRAGYAWSAWGENIHRGPKTAVRAMEGWMNSDGHRRNILNCAFKDVGVGVTLSPNGPWWVQNFGVRR
ncbi:CAP domain-containing protein [Streptomyces sp. NPDC048577]|uniref:CAP domain-containing protein n=1 Tax=Streptomyces sp. NPDC048577 TaxID=3157209 RepID=UPI003427A0A1